MSNQIQPFAFEDHLVRVVMQNDEPWFILADVCRVLGIGNPSMAAEKLDDDEKGISPTYTLGGSALNLTEGALSSNSPIIISESGLYTIILRSRTATTPGSAAHRFRKWVTAEVLPSIRKSGRYDMPQPANEDSDEDGSLGPLSEISVRARLVEIAERLSGKPAARALWRQLGLPWVEEMEEAAIAVSGRTQEDDAVARFAVEGIERAPGIVTPTAVLWRAFVTFCESTGLTNPGSGTFYKRFSRMGFPKGKSNGTVYHGIRPASRREGAAGI